MYMPAPELETAPLETKGIELMGKELVRACRDRGVTLHALIEALRDGVPMSMLPCGQARP